MVSVCLPSDALLQHLPFYLRFSYLGRGVSLHGCSSKAQLLLLTLDEGYRLTTALTGTVKEKEHGAVPAAPVQCGAVGKVVGQTSRHSQCQRSPGRQLIRSRWWTHAACRYFKPHVSRALQQCKGLATVYFCFLSLSTIVKPFSSTCNKTYNTLLLFFCF